MWDACGRPQRSAVADEDRPGGWADELVPFKVRCSRRLDDLPDDPLLRSDPDALTLIAAARRAVDHDSDDAEIQRRMRAVYRRLRQLRFEAGLRRIRRERGAGAASAALRAWLGVRAASTPAPRRPASTERRPGTRQAPRRPTATRGSPSDDDGSDEPEPPQQLDLFIRRSAPDPERSRAILSNGPTGRYVLATRGPLPPNEMAREVALLPNVLWDRLWAEIAHTVGAWERLA